MACIVALFLCALSVVAASAQTFQNPRAIHVDGPAPNIATADMNNDGRLDLIVQTGDTVTPSSFSVLLADAAGNYSSSGQINSTSVFMYPCMPADVNGDKKIDILCADAPAAGGNGEVTVYLGNGDGTVQPPISIALGYIGVPHALPEVIAVADFNNDGHADALVTTGPPGAWAAYSYMLLGDGTGHFTVKPLYETYNRGPATVADVNGDNIPDLLMSPGPIIYLGKGDGTFSGQFFYMNGKCIFADFEKTGKLDAACQMQGGSLKVFHENADGSLNTSTPIATITLTGAAQYAYPLAAADMNGDGILDLLISSNDGIQVMLGKPGLAFGTPVPYAAGSAESASATGFVADMDGDGHPDVVASGPHNVYISYGSSSGALDAPRLIQTGGPIYTSKATDFDDDKFADVVAIGPSGLNFLHGKGDGTFAPPVALQLPTGYTNLANNNLQNTNDLIVGDFNGDGNKDFLIPAGLFADNLLFFGNGAGSFAPAVVVSGSMLPAVTSYHTLVVADVNGDGKDDLVVVQATEIDAYLSHGDGTFSLLASTFANATNQNTAVAFADFNGDHILDAVVDLADHAIVLTGNGDGSFASTTTSVTIPAISGLNEITNIVPLVATGDFDGDGKQDIALRGSYTDFPPDLYLGGSGVRYSDALWVYYGNGDKTFSSGVSAGLFNDQYFSTLIASPLHAGDVSHLLLANVGNVGSPDAAPIAFVSPHTDRTFGPPLYFVGGEALDSAQFVDFNNDGKLDLFVSNGTWWNTSGLGADTFAALLNQPVELRETVLLNPVPSLAGKPYDATATLVSFQSQLSSITGAINFSVDGTAIGSQNLSGNSAKQTISTNLTGGDHQITAAWPGDDTFAPASVTVVQHIMDFALTADSAVSIQTGHTGTVALHLKSIDGFGDTLALSCAGLPSYATCTFATPAPTISSGQTIDTQVTIGTGTTTQAQLTGSYTPLFAFLPAAFLLLFVPRRSRSVILLAVASATLLAVSACGGGRGSGGAGGGGGGGTQSTSTPPGTYNITITAQAKNTQLQRGAAVTLTVTK